MFENWSVQTGTSGSGSTLFHSARAAIGATTSLRPALPTPQLRDRLHRIDPPTRRRWGENDGMVSTDYGAALRDLIPGARLSVIPDSGHHPHIEQPGEFVARFLEFASG